MKRKKPDRLSAGKRPGRRGRWLLFLFVPLVAGAAAGVEYARLNPVNHFAHLPVVAAPRASKTATLPSRHHGEFNLLLLGVDARTPGAPARSDSLILIHANLLEHQYDILSIARDSRVDIPPYGMTKITHANYMGDLKGGTPMGGIRLATQIVSDFTGLPVNYYAETNHFGLQALVNSIGGVRVHVPFPVPIVNAWYPALNGHTIPAGYDELNGEMAAELVHQRELLPQGDFSRQLLQEDLLVAIARKLRNPVNWPRIPAFLHSLPQFLTATNFSVEDMLSLAMDLRDFHKSQVHYYQIPGAPGQFMDPIVGLVLDYWVPNMPALHRIIQEHFEN